MTTKLNSADIAARLLATENITVVRARVGTASFDIKSRVLSLPQWKDMTPSIEGMLIGHEVGHALYTSEDYLIPIAENPALKGYLNVLEDVRIEKLMKRKYPGIRKTMTEGYKELNERDFFGVSKVQDMSALILIDRINLYYKAGFSCGVKFTPEEKEFVIRAENTETIEDITQLAKEIYAYSKQSIKDRNESSEITPEDEQDEKDQEELLENNDYDNFDDITFSDEDDIEEEGEEEPKEYSYEGNDKLARRQSTVRGEITDAEIEKELESITDKTFHDNLSASADETTEYNYYTLDENYQFNPIIGYKQVILDTAYVDEDLSEYEKNNVTKFKEESSKVVNYLIKEFEMRKSATLYKRAQTSRIGSLDMSKVWSYKLNEDLFKRVTTFPQGKNHGMIFLLDWSGSMDHVLNDTIRQVISLAMFCQRAQIPYQVFAFTTQYLPSDYNKLHDLRVSFSHRKDNVLSNASYPFALLEFFSSKMTNSEFNTMVRRVFEYNKLRHCRNGEYSTGGTPLNEALAYMVPHINSFIKTHNVEKMSLITLTDGEGGGLHSPTGAIDEYRFDYGSYKKITCKNFLHDPVTKKNYSITRYGTSHTDAILRMIKDRYGINSVGFYICPNARRVLADAVNNNINGFKGNMEITIAKIREEFRDNGFASLKNTGRDDLFVVPTNKLNVNESELSINSDQNARSIARSLSKHMNAKKTSRILLDRFIGYIA
jgi:uncharacterized protein with von Willebrand factor type A (vWA) domain